MRKVGVSGARFCTVTIYHVLLKRTCMSIQGLLTRLRRIFSTHTMTFDGAEKNNTVTLYLHALF